MPRYGNSPGRVVGVGMMRSGPLRIGGRRPRTVLRSRGHRRSRGIAGTRPGRVSCVWPVHEELVRRLRCRIFKASKAGDLAAVRNLQKMMLRSWSNTLVSVRQVTQRNAGRGTAGVDGQVALTSPARMDLAVLVHRTVTSFQPLPVRRVFIPKANGKRRPLGIPAIADRAHQARCRNALEPEWL